MVSTVEGSLKWLSSGGGEIPGTRGCGVEVTPGR
jgi:hypothetical protein